MQITNSYSQNSIQDAERAIKNKEYELAIKIAQPYAQKGNSAAQAILGFVYLNGYGVSQNYSEALKYFKLSSDQNNSYSQNMIGLMYANGNGVEKNIIEAVKYFKQSAAQGYSLAQTNLALAYLKGEGVPQNYNEALKWLKLAVKQNYPQAQYELANLYLNGSGVELNLQEALRYYKLSADQGFSNAENQLGIIYELGRGVPRNYEQAIFWYKKSAEKNNLVAKLNIARMTSNGIGIKQDLFRGNEMYIELADKGYAPAQALISLNYRTGKFSNVDYAKGFEWAKKAAMQNDFAGIHELALYYLGGLGIEKDFNKGFSDIKNLADKKYDRAYFTLASVYYDLAKNDEDWARQYGKPEYQFNEAKKYANLIIEKGNFVGYHVIGLMKINGFLYEKNKIEGIADLKKAVETGYTASFVELAKILSEDESNIISLKYAMMLYKLAEEGSDIKTKSTAIIGLDKLNSKFDDNTKKNIYEKSLECKNIKFFINCENLLSDDAILLNSSLIHDGNKSGIVKVDIKKNGNTYTVPVQINGQLTLDFVIDSGASDITIPADVVLTLIRTGTISEKDFLKETTYKLADGSSLPSQNFNLKSIKVGDKILHDVVCGVTDIKGSLLLGQSFFGKLNSWSIDNKNKQLILD
jgi:TPR repeat protein